MSLKTLDDAKIAIEEIQQSINEMEGNTMLVFDNICQIYGDITDLQSFIEFYRIYFLDFQILNEEEFEKEAKELWEIIDVNKDDKLDEKEIENLVKNISFQSIKKIKKHFKIE